MIGTKPKFELGERCFQFSLRVVRQVDFYKECKVPYSLIDQFLRAATSVGANVIEGQGSGSDKEFLRYYRIALKSANETKFWLALIRDTGKGNKESVNTLLQELIEIANILASSVKTLKGN